jgi:hypothetical protein
MRITVILFAAIGVSLPAQSQPCAIAQADFNTANYDINTSMGGPNLLVAIQITAPTTYVATRIEVFTGNGTGTNTVAIWSHDTNNNQPLAMLGQGSWQMSRVRSWQGANLTQPVVVSQAQVIWLVWAPVNGAQASVEGNGAGAQPYRSSFNGGQTWGGPYQGHQWKFRVYGGSCGQCDVFGTGCAGQSRVTPELGWGAVPAAGGTLNVMLQNGVPNDFAVLSVGDSNTVWNAQPLPYDLAPYGAAGCLIRCSVVVTVLTPTDPATGAAVVVANIPPNPALYGVRFFDQWLVHDATANALGYKVSNAGSGVVGL